MASAKKVSPANLAAAGGVLNFDVSTEGLEDLTVIGDLGPGATAAGDVVVTVQPYLSDYQDAAWRSGSGTNDGAQTDPALADVGLDLVPTTIYPGVSAYLSGGHARVMVRMRVVGFSVVRITLKNNNATTALPARIDYFG